MSFRHTFSLFGLLLASFAYQANGFELGRSEAVIFASSKDLPLAVELRDYLTTLFEQQYTVVAYSPAVAQSAGVFVGVTPADFPLAEEEKSGKEFCVMHVRSNQLHLFGSERFPS